MFETKNKNRRFQTKNGGGGLKTRKKSLEQFLNNRIIIDLIKANKKVFNDF